MPSTYTALPKEPFSIKNGRTFRGVVEAIKANPEHARLRADLDGTLGVTELYPAAPRQHRTYGELAEQLNELLDFGLVTGRSYEQTVTHGFALTNMPVVGQFGCTYTDRDGNEHEWVGLPDLTRVDEEMRLLVHELTNDGHESALEDVKSHFRALHYGGSTPPKVVEYLEKRLTQVADAVGLKCKPGNKVIEVGPSVDKGNALRRELAEGKVSALIVAGDGDPDLALFLEAERRAKKGTPCLKVAVGDNPLLTERADVVAEDPEGMTNFLWVLLWELRGQ